MSQLTSISISFYDLLWSFFFKLFLLVSAAEQSSWLSNAKTQYSLMPLKLFQRKVCKIRFCVFI